MQTNRLGIEGDEAIKTTLDEAGVKPEDIRLAPINAKEQGKVRPEDANNRATILPRYNFLGGRHHMN